MKGELSARVPDWVSRRRDPHYVVPPVRKGLKNLARDAATRVLGTAYAVFFDPVFCLTLQVVCSLERSATHLGAERSTLFARQRAQAQLLQTSPSTSRGWVTRRFWTRRTT